MNFKNYLKETIIIRDEHGELETLNWKFNKKNVNKIAYNYDAIIKNIDQSSATLKDNRGRLIFVDIKRKKHARNTSN